MQRAWSRDQAGHRKLPYSVTSGAAHWYLWGIAMKLIFFCGGVRNHRSGSCSRSSTSCAKTQGHRGVKPEADFRDKRLQGKISSGVRG